jgi:hypothetical protein
MTTTRSRQAVYLSVAALILVTIPLHSAHAGLFSFAAGAIEDGLATLATLAVQATSFLVYVAGGMLNFSINLTLHIRDFVNSTPAVYTTWRALRDISGIFLIFFLLYAAFQLILGRNAKFGDLIRNLVMAGILINFSFFFAGLGIDASNIVSVQLYNAIAPAQSLNAGGANSNIFGPSTAGLADGGLSNIFMNSLKIQTMYKDGTLINSTDPTGKSGVFTNSVKIIIAGMIGVVIEFAAAMSFGAAAIAFVFRFVILIMLLAFSPVWMLGFLPNVGEYTKKWVDHYKQMLIFMPVYLLLMYFALNVLTSSSLFGSPTGNAGETWYGSLLVLAVNAAIVIFLLNLPLAAAASIAGGTIGILKKAEASFSTGKVWSNVGGYFGMTSVGRVGGRLEKGFAYGPLKFKGLENTKLGNTVLGKSLRESTTGALAKNKMGGSMSFEELEKEKKDLGKKRREIDRTNALKAVLAGREVKDATEQGKLLTTKSALGSMSGKERVGAVAARMKDEKSAKQVLKYLRDDDFDSIKKSEEWSDEDKGKISKWRREALDEAVRADDKEAVESMVSNMSGKDLLKMGDELLRKEAVIVNLKPGQLKQMSDEGIKDETKRYIGGRILNSGTPHKSRGFVNKNKDWSGEDSGTQTPPPTTPPAGGPTIYDGRGRPVS